MKGLGAVLNHIADDIPSVVKASYSLGPTESVKRQIKEYLILMPLKGGYRGRPVTLHWPT